MSSLKGSQVELCLPHSIPDCLWQDLHWSSTWLQESWDLIQHIVEGWTTEITNHIQTLSMVFAPLREMNTVVLGKHSAGHLQYLHIMFVLTCAVLALPSPIQRYF